MKKTKGFGKVHPLTSSSPADSLSVLKLLPAAFISLIALLSLDDRQVLAYMLTRSLKSTDLISSPKPPPPCFHRRKSPALFDCDCFLCYTSFWFRWDSSPNRDLIHRAIEAFEDHLTTGEQLGKPARKRDKMARRKIKPAAVQPPEKRQTEHPGTRNFQPAAENNNNNLLAAAPVAVGRSHKGLARKVLPDVMGIFSSRLWSLWSPKV